MANVSRPLLALLVSTVAVFALWLVALKPSSSSTPGQPQGLGQYQSAINKAHSAVLTANAANIAEGATLSTAPPSSLTVEPHPVQPTPVTHTATVHAAAGGSPVARALQSGKVLALLFYNPAASDDQALKQELAAVPTHSGRVFKLAIPLSQLANYVLVTGQVPVQVSPTLVLIDSKRQASTIVGFADRFEISQRVADALSS